MELIYLICNWFMEYAIDLWNMEKIYVKKLSYWFV